MSTKSFGVSLIPAHIIRTRSTRKYRDVHSLKARYRWCLTGTPIFNRVEDLGSLLGFLRASPFDITSTFNSRVKVPVTNQKQSGLQTLQRLVQAVSLRRTKDAIKDDLQLPLRQVVDCRVRLSNFERKNYRILQQSYSSFLLQEDPFPKSRNPMSGVMQTIQRLRQFCNHGLDLLPRTVLQLFDGPWGQSPSQTDLFDSSEKCAICMKVFDTSSVGLETLEALECGHCFCIDCQKRIGSNDLDDEPQCYLCSASIPSPKPWLGNTDPQSGYVPSSKVRSLLENLRLEHEADTQSPLKRYAYTKTPVNSLFLLGNN